MERQLANGDAKNSQSEQAHDGGHVADLAFFAFT